MSPIVTLFQIAQHMPLTIAEGTALYMKAIGFDTSRVDRDHKAKKVSRSP